jgi:hypothetical protein
VNEGALRHRVTKDIGRPVQDAVWRELRIDRHVAEVLADPDDYQAYADLLGKARRLHGLGGRDASERVDPAVPDATLDRAYLLSDLAAEIAAEDPDVLRFRKSWLKAGLILEREVRHRLDESPLMREEWEKLAGRLARRYAWQDEAAAHFVLSGVKPLVVPVELGIQEHFGSGTWNAQITIKAQAWVNPKIVLDAYREAHDLVLKGHNRKLSDKRLALARFAVDWRRHHPDKATAWTAMMREWSSAHPAWAEGDRGHFMRAVERVERSLLRPRYRMVRDAPLTAALMPK